ncbi:diguanylate cyclase [Cellulomonas sp. NPDC058312]|uniref:diguanylate cyclase n=1 Tax=Cellulomonas sp. NPDC058312 TaxID=3346441 RepID=UPI0036E505AB
MTATLTEVTGTTAPLTDWDTAVDELALLADSDAAACARRAEQLLPAATAQRAGGAEMRLRYHAAVAHHALGEDSRALAHAVRAEHLARERGALVWESRALARQGVVHHDLGQLEDAVDLLTRAAELRREADDTEGTADVLTILGSVYTSMPHFAPQAAGVLTQARRLWLAAGDPDRASIALANLARTFVEASRRLAQDNPRGARASARRALALALEAVDEADAAGLSRTGVDARLTVATAHLLAGDAVSAAAVLDAAESMLRRFPSTGQLLTLHRIRAGLLAEAGRFEDAVAEARAGMTLSDAVSRPAERMELLRVLSDAHEVLGDTAAALAELRELYALTVRMGDAQAERRATLLGARMEVEQAERQAEAERRRSEALEESNARLAHEAAHDGLTGLANRRTLDTELERWSQERSAFTVALVDVDHFKRVNDTWSHQVGDAVLVRVADVLQRALRRDDLAARYGGEEFAVLLDGLSGPPAHDVCDRLRATVAGLRWDDLMPGATLTVSMGVAVRQADETVAQLLARADAALYRAKAEGRNRVCLSGPPVA